MVTGKIPKFVLLKRMPLLQNTCFLHTYKGTTKLNEEIKIFSLDIFIIKITDENFSVNGFFSLK